MPSERQGLMIGALTALVVSLWVYPWLDARRFADATTGPVRAIRVSTAADGGPGSLREALFRAIRSGEATRIEIDEARIALGAPLPPVVSERGLVIAATAGTVIDAAGLDRQPVFDIRSGRVRLENVAIVAAPHTAIRVAGSGDLRLRGVRISRADVAVGVSGEGLVAVEDGTFEHNRVGIEALGSPTVTIERSRFVGHGESAIWAVGPSDLADASALTLDVSRSSFDGGRYGVVAVNTRARLDANEIANASNDGVLSIGGSLTMHANRIRGVAGGAIRAVGDSRGHVAANEIHESGLFGILLQQTTSARVEDNRLYRNGYGIVSVRSPGPASVEMTGNLVVSSLADGLVAMGDAPAMRGNTSVDNRHAGIRAFHLVRPAGRTASAPLLIGNTLRGNGVDVVYSDYVTDAHE